MFAFAALCAFSVSCSTVEESRSDCPCLLSIDCSYISKGVENVQIWLFDADGSLMLKDTVGKDEFGTKRVIKVKRGTLFCYAWGNIGRATVCTELFSKSTFLEKKGAESADSLFFFDGRIEARGEDAVVSVMPYKEFATVYLSFEGVGNEEVIESVLVCPSGGFFVTGNNVEKQSVTSGSTGDAIVAIPKSIDYLSKKSVNSITALNSLNFRMLRQKSTEGIVLRLKILSGGKEEDAGVFELGKYLKEAGYDMSDKNLKDIDLKINISAMSAIVTVGDWSIEAPVTIEF